MEDFVPFEIAKKLEEKGFREECFARYYCSDKAYFEENSYNPDTESIFYCYNNDEDLGRFYIDAPTISQVLKWLRNEKKIWICVNPVKSGFETTIYDSVKQYYNGEYGGWMYYNNLVTTLHFGLNYENSVIDGIKYVLDNLI